MGVCGKFLEKKIGVHFLKIFITYFIFLYIYESFFVLLSVLYCKHIRGTSCILTHSYHLFPLKKCSSKDLNSHQHSDGFIHSIISVLEDSVVLVLIFCQNFQLVYLSLFDNITELFFWGNSLLCLHIGVLRTSGTPCIHMYYSPCMYVNIYLRFFI